MTFLSRLIGNSSCIIPGKPFDICSIGFSGINRKPEKTDNVKREGRRRKPITLIEEVTHPYHYKFLK